MNLGPHLMVDCETLGLTERAVVLSVGAVLWRINGETGRPDVKEASYWALQWPRDQRGRETDDATLRFWLGARVDPEAALAALQPAETVPSVFALRSLATKMALVDGNVWAWPASFDGRILESLYESLSPERAGGWVPERKWQCGKTLWNQTGRPEPERDTAEECRDGLGSYPPHHPVEDCLRQVHRLTEALMIVGERTLR